MLYLHAFSTSELAAFAALPHATMVGVIDTMSDDSLVLLKTELTEPLRYELSQDAFFRVQSDVAGLSNTQGAPLLLSVAKAHLLRLEVDGRYNTAIEHQRIASHLDWAEKMLTGDSPPVRADEYLMDVDAARLVLERNIRVLLLS
jgi:hypothetical protein